MDQINPEAAKIVKGLALTENGGKVDVNNPKAGQSGEMKSLFQFTPGTWKMYSHDVLGQEVPMSSESETAVVYQKVSGWLKAGFSADQIASIWNSGNPDAYLQDHKGVNKYGVKYDTPGYVKKFNEYIKQSGEPVNKPSQSNQQTSVPPLQPQIHNNFAISSPVGNQLAQAEPPVKNPIKSNKTLPQLLQKQIKPI